MQVVVLEGLLALYTVSRVLQLSLQLALVRPALLDVYAALLLRKVLRHAGDEGRCSAFCVWLASSVRRRPDFTVELLKMTELLIFFR